MALSLIIESEAQKEVDSAILYYEEQRNGLGLEFLLYLDGYFTTLKNNTASFQVKRKPVFKELPLKRFPFTII